MLQQKKISPAIAQVSTVGGVTVHVTSLIMVEKGNVSCPKTPQDQLHKLAIALFHLQSISDTPPVGHPGKRNSVAVGSGDGVWKERKNKQKIS